MVLQRFCLSLFALVLAAAASLASAQEIRYISDKQFIPVRSGPGNQFRIVHRGLPSGTKLTVLQESEDGVYSEISTDRGTTGWLRTQYLMSEQPAQLLVDTAEARAAQLAESNRTLQDELNGLNSERDELQGELQGTGGELTAVTEELAALKQISGNAVKLDTDNRRLVQQAEVLKAEVETLEAENQRLNDKLRSEAFMDGALAVLMGVIIALVVPRLWPKRRRSSSWA